VVGAGRYEIPGVLTFTGDFLDTAYKFNPDDPLPHFMEITVNAGAEDLKGNVLAGSYSFTTRSFKLEEPDDGEVFDTFGRGAGTTIVSAAVKGAETRGTPGDVDVTFEWEEVVRADSYELLVDDNDDFSSPEVHETGIVDTEYTHTFTVTEDVTYYWYIVCNAPEGDFDSADVFSFEFNYNNTNVAPSSLGRIKAGFTE